MIKEAQSEYPNSIKIFNERFAKLKEEFEKPVTFEQFASDACIYFNMHERWYNTKINKCIVEINKRLYKFVRSILFYMDLELERKEHKCPCCSGQTSRIHDYRTQKVHDINILGKKVYLILRKK